MEDFKARTRGDTVTVVITENASASKSATTSTNRQTAVHAGIPNFLGLETNVFDANTEKLLWSIRTETGLSRPPQEEIKPYVGLVTDKLFRAKWFK